MFTERLRRVSYGWLIFQGLIAALAPKRSIDMSVKLWGFPFENVDAVEPKAWYVRSVRAAGVGMLTTGLTGLLFEQRASREETGADDEDEEPVEIDV